MKKERNQSIELLRVILMTLIVFGHIIGHGIGGGRYDTDGTPSMGALLQPLYSYHVDAFIFISGYYGIKLKWEKFLMLVWKWIFYSAVAVCIVMFMTNNNSIVYLLKNIFPISTCDQWFMSQYLYLMLMAPLLNVGIDTLTKKQSTAIIVVMYISSFRLYSCLMVFVYLLGRYFKKYPISWLEKYSAWIFIGTLTIYSIFNLGCLCQNIYPEKMFYYMSPFLIISAVALFFAFQKIQIRWKVINFIATGVISTYLITDHELLRPFFTQETATICNNSPISIIFVALGITVLCSLLDASISVSTKHIYHLIIK